MASSKDLFNATFKPAFGLDKKSDFVNSIAQALGDDRANPEQLPSLFPVPDQLEDNEEGTDPLASRVRDTVPGLQAEYLETKYAQFDIADPLDVEKLEEINNNVMRKQWILAKEDWNHTKDGGTFIVVKYLINNTPAKSEKSKKREPPVHPGVNGGSSSEPL